MLTPSDLVRYNILENTYSGQYRPSMEVQTHAKIYLLKKEAKAVLHAHPPLTIALVDHGYTGWWKTDLVEAEYSIGEAAVAKPAPPGSPQLAENVGECVEKGAQVVIVPRHGVFAWGTTVWSALDAIMALEYTAKYYIIRRMLEKL
jgi:L-fuculose-phosphate aldolase